MSFPHGPVLPTKVRIQLSLGEGDLALDSFSGKRVPGSSRVCACACVANSLAVEHMTTVSVGGIIILISGFS